MKTPDSRETWTMPLVTHSTSRPRAQVTIARVKSTAALSIPPYSEMAVQLRSDRHGLSLVRPMQRKDKHVFLSNGLIEVPEDTPWTVLVANFSSVPVYVSRGQVLGMIEEPPVHGSAGSNVCYTPGAPKDTE